MLQFVKWAAFSDTFEPYRVWKIWRAVPDLDIERGHLLHEVGPGTRDRGMNKEPLWDGNRFQVRDDDDDVICNLEEWQVAKLFGDRVPPWPLEGLAMGEFRRILMEMMPLGPEALGHLLKVGASMAKSMLEKMPKEQPKDAEPMPPGAERVLSLIDGGYWSAALVREDIPALDLRKGDALVYAVDEDRRPDMQGRVRWLSIEEYAALREAVGPGTIDPIPGGRAYDSVHDFVTSKGKWGKRLKVWHSRLAVLRPPWENVTESIHATSDDAAIFELLHQVGGRMPEAANG